MNSLTASSLSSNSHHCRHLTNIWESSTCQVDRDYVFSSWGGHVFVVTVFRIFINDQLVIFYWLWGIIILYIVILFLAITSIIQSWFYAHWTVSLSLIQKKGLLQSIRDPTTVISSAFQSVTSHQCTNWINDCGYEQMSLFNDVTIYINYNDQVRSIVV